MKQNYSLQNISEIAKYIIANVNSKIVLFNGEMGAGKTTLIKEITKQLGVNDIANSPTFSLVNEYETVEGLKIYHFDFYRINSEEEAYDIGIEDYLYSNTWCFIEWGEKIKNLLPLDIVNINIITNSDNERTLEIEQNG